MEYRQTSPEPSSSLPPIRHDGWTGEKMAIFCEALAETAIVAQACEEARMGISGAYAARRRNPLFAAAWAAALSIARDRLADTLLARSIDGNVEQIYRDGELVGERHFLDNRLGLQILRRFDRLAEQLHSPASVGAGAGRSAPAKQLKPIDWNLAVGALRIGDDAAVARALALIDPGEVEEVEGDPNLPLREEDQGLDLSDRCWWEDDEDCWLTDFPPPPGFDGYESHPYDEADDGDRYVRACTGEETAVLEADRAADRASERAEEEALRDGWFEMLKAELPAASRLPRQE